MLKSKMTPSSGTIGTSWMPSAVGPPEPDGKKVSNSREEQHSAVVGNHN